MKYIKIFPELLETENYDSCIVHFYSGDTLVAEKRLSKETILANSERPSIPINVKGRITNYRYTLSQNDTVREYDFIFKAVTQEVTETKLFRKNENILYANTSEDKALINELLTTMANASLALDNTPVGSKNLIYFTIGGDTKYIRLLELAISSLLTNNPALNADILVLTTNSFLPALQESNIFSHSVSVNYYVLDTPSQQDGVAISMNKLRIFDYPLIDDYSKILFLDCDIMCIGDIDSIFSSVADASKFNSVCNPVVNADSFNSVYHGLGVLETGKLEELSAAGQLPFNAGQFMITNTAQMRSHFDNILWLVSNWPDFYFFEQSFMNHYFCGFLLADNTYLNGYFSLITVNLSAPLTKAHSDTNVFLHFIAPSLDPEAKLKFLTDYSYANQLQF